jgi:hypothetical protein
MRYLKKAFYYFVVKGVEIKGEDLQPRDQGHNPPNCEEYFSSTIQLG